MTTNGQPLMTWEAFKADNIRRVLGHDPPPVPDHLRETPGQRQFRLRVRRLLALRKRLTRLVGLVVRRVLRHELRPLVAAVARLEGGGR
jgi:hypothetical protein